MRRRAPLRCASLPGLLLDALLLAALLLASGCGKKGPPQAPIRILPGPAREARVRQVGPDVVLTALLPDRKTDGTPLESGTQVRVLRMPATATLRPGLVSARYLERQFEREAKVVASFAIDGKKGLPPGGRLRFRDPAPMAAAVARGPVRHLYGILVVGADGKRSGLTPPLEIEVQPPPGSAANLKLETAEGEVRLAWDPPAGHEAPPARPSAPPLLYNVYRRTATEGEEPDAPLNPQPLKETKFVDRSFRYGEVYRYSIRVLVSPGPPLRESVATPEAEVRPVDVYAAAAPTGLAVSLEGGVIKVYWFPNSEPDLAGYRIYRRVAPGGEFTLLGQVGAAETAFADTTARPGVRYDYAVTAIDGATPPNESGRSETRSETLPAEGPTEGKP